MFRLTPETRNRLFVLTKAHIKGRYERSMLGMLWYVLIPIFFYVALLTIFRQRLGRDIEYYPVYLFIGVILWNAFVSISGAVMRSVEANRTVIKSMPIPPQMFIYVAVLACALPFLVEFSILMVVCLILGTGSIAPFSALFSLVLLILFAAGIGYILLTCYTYVRDTLELWSFVSRLWWFITPIVYTLSENGPGRTLNMWNPMFHIIDMMRLALIYGRTPEPAQWLMGGAQVAATLVIGLLCFRFVRFSVAEHI